MKIYVWFGEEEDAWELEYEELTGEEEAEEKGKTVRDVLEHDFDMTFAEDDEPEVQINGEPGDLDHEIEDEDDIEFPYLEDPVE